MNTQNRKIETPGQRHTRAQMDLLQLACLGNQGAYVSYSQDLPDTDSVIRLLPETDPGICQALAAKWIAQHANGSSLWNWLFKPGTQTVNKGAVTQLMLQFIDSTARHGPLANPTNRDIVPGVRDFQEIATDRYLRLYRVIQRRIANTAFMGTLQNRIRTGLNGFPLAYRLHENFLNSRGGSYALVSVIGPDGGHALAAWVGEDIAFFDPNFGEFWFPTHQNFQRWFVRYWSITDYKQYYDTFWITPYGREA